MVPTIGLHQILPLTPFASWCSLWCTRSNFGRYPSNAGHTVKYSSWWISLLMHSKATSLTPVWKFSEPKLNNGAPYFLKVSQIITYYHIWPGCRYCTRYRYLGWWLDNISASLGHVNHEKEIVQWMGPSLTSAVLQEMCQLKYLRRNTSPPLSIHLSNTCSSFSFSDLSSLQHLYDITMHQLVIDNLLTPSGRPAFKRALHLHQDYKYCRKIYNQP